MFQEDSLDWDTISKQNETWQPMTGSHKFIYMAKSLLKCTTPLVLSYLLKNTHSYLKSAIFPRLTSKNCLVNIVLTRILQILRTELIFAFVKCN